MNPIKTLFLLFSLLAIHHSLFAKNALPLLVEGGEPFENREDFYIPSRIEVRTVAISFNGKIIISSAYNSVEIWDITSGKILKSLEWNLGSKAIAISHDDKFIISNSYRSIKIWDAKSGKELKKLKGHTQSINSIAISPNDKIIVSGSSDKSIRIWDIKTGKELKKLKGHTKAINSIAISPNGKTIVSGSSDKSIKIWDMKTGKELKSLTGHTSTIRSVAISPNSKIIVSGSLDKSIKIWDMETGKELKSLKGHTNGISSVAISPNNKIIVSGSFDKSIKIWDIKTGKVLKSLKGHTKSITSVAINPNSKIIVSGSSDNSIKIWDIKRGQEIRKLRGHTEIVSSIAITPDGKTIVSGSGTLSIPDDNIKIWDIENNKELSSLYGHKRMILSIVITVDNKTIVSSSADGNIKIWDIENKKILKSLETKQDWINSISISNKGKLVSGSSTSNSIKIWDMKTGKELKSLKGDTSTIRSVAISPDSKIIVSGSGDKSIKIWDMETGRELKTLKGHKDAINSVAISPDSKIIVSGSGDKSIKIWDMETGRELKTLKGHKDAINSVAISPNSKIIVSGSKDGSIKIWDIEKGKELKSLKWHNDSIFDVSISPDGKTIISSSLDRTVRYWNIHNGKELKELIGGQDGTWMIFDYEKKRFYRGDDGTLLYKKNGANLTSVYPKLSKKDYLSFVTTENNINTLNEKKYSYNLTLKNQTTENIYWIKNSYNDNYCIIKDSIINVLKKEHNLTLNIYCKLPRKNPKPINNHDINLTFTTATDSNFTLPIKVSIRYANITIKKAELSKDKKNLNIELTNIGNEPLKNAKVKLSKPFDADIQDLAQLEVNVTKVVSYALPLRVDTFSLFGFELFRWEEPIELDKNATIDLDVFIPNTKLEKENPKADVAPSYIWEIRDTPIVFKTAWYIYALLILIILLLLLLIWYLLTKKPKSIITLSPTALKKAKEKLEAKGQWETTLQLAKTTNQKVENALKFYQNPTVETLATHLNINHTQKGEFHKLKTPNLGVTIDNFLLLLTNKNAESIKEQYLTGDKIFIVTTEEYQDEIAELAREKKNNLIAPNSSELTEMLLSQKPKEVLVRILARCLSFKHLSPYKTKGGIKNGNNFFGRTEIIKEMTTKEGVSYLLVGARQMGKSSILEELRRHYANSSTVECHYFNLEDGSMIREMNKALKLDKESSLERIIEEIESREKKVIFLIDEADKFVESSDNEKISSTFRKLSQENHALFVLAGFWRLYESVTMDYHSPLKNFGEMIHLSKLEDEACHELMIKPMRRIEVEYEDLMLIDEVVSKCGNRANLIAMVCDNIVKGLENKTITQKDITQAMEQDNIAETLMEWEGLSSGRENSINRLIVYLTFEMNSFSLTDVVNGIKKEGVEIGITEVERSLRQLVLGYVIQKRKSRYYYPIPLLIEMLLEDKQSVETQLKGIVLEL